jgi:hypothetical protein
MSSEQVLLRSRPIAAKCCATRYVVVDRDIENAI